MTKRIRVIDLEFTGDGPADGGLIEIGFWDLVSDEDDLAGSPINWRVGEGRGRFCNPGMSISPESQAVHHIDDADVADAPKWKSLFAGLLKQADADGVIAYAAHGADTESAWMHPDWLGETPLPVLCTYKAALRVWPDAPQHKNQTLRYWRRPAGLDRELASPAHRAAPDAYVTAHLLRDLLNDEGVSIEQMIKWSSQPALTVRCYLGAYRNEGKGTLWADVETSMLEWIISKGFEDKPDIRFTAEYHLEQRRIDQRIEREDADLNEQLEANGLNESAPAQEGLLPL